MPTWIQAFLAADVPPGGACTFDHGDDHVCVFHADDGALYAVDARCPHEGYPLAKGDVVGTTLTCRWHNFKFDLRDGACLVGDEPVRHVPLRIVDGRVELDLAGPPPALAQARMWASLDGAMARRRLGQAARDVVRLLRLGVAPVEIAVAAARFDGARGEYGPGHALPVATDVAAIARRRGVDAAALPLLLAVDMASESSVRREPRVGAAAPSSLPGDAGALEAALRAHVVAEDAGAAEALIAAACAAGRGADAGQALLALCCDHFVDLGHTLIFQAKAHELLDELGWDRAGELLPATAYGLVLGTVEDGLPKWSRFRAQLDLIEPRLPALAATPARPATADAVLALAATITDGARDAVVDAITDALAGGLAPAHVADALVLGASERILRFDVAIDADPTVQEDWLDVTHVLTYASAARATLARLDRADALRPLWFAARFVQVSSALDGRARPHLPVVAHVPEARGPIAVAAAVAAVDRHDAEAAVHHAALAIAAGGVEPLCDALEDWGLVAGGVRPIVTAHVIKMLRAARREHAALGWLGVPARAPVLATVRFLASPVRERRSAQLVHEAERFLIDGKVPRTLT